MIATIIILGYWQRWTWTGLETKSAWDRLELLGIPLVLGAGAFWFNNQTRKSEQELAQHRVREEALQGYLDRMQELILEKGLRRSEKDAEIRDVARARTLTVLRSLSTIYVPCIGLVVEFCGGRGHQVPQSTS